MAKITFKIGDYFSTKDGHGVVTSKGRAFTITGEGGRTGWKMNVSPIPEDAMPSDLNTNVSFEVQMALNAIYFLRVSQLATKH